MKLPDGITVYRGGKKYRGSIPDDMMPTFKTQAVAVADIDADEKPRRKKPQAEK